MNFRLLFWRTRVVFSGPNKKDEIPESKWSRLKKNLELRKSNLVMNNARFGVKEFVGGI